MQKLTLGLYLLANFFGMHDTPTGGHPVHCPRANRLDKTEAVTVQYLSVEKIGNRCEAYVRVGTNIHPGARRKMRGAHVIEKYKRPDTLALAVRKRSRHREFAQILGYRPNSKFDSIFGHPYLLASERHWGCWVSIPSLLPVLGAHPASHERTSVPIVPVSRPAAVSSAKHRRRRLDRRRSAQAWAAAIRLWLRIVSRYRSRPAVQTWLTVHVFFISRSASWRNQS